MSFVNRISPPKVDNISVITASEINNIGADLAKAVDGAAGGTYTPSDPVIIGGDGLTCTGQFTASGATCTLSATANSITTATTISGALTASSVTSLTMSGTNKISLASRSISKVQSSLMYNFDTGENQPGSIVIGFGESGGQSLLLPNGCTLTGVTCYINPTDDTLPTVNFRLGVYKMVVSTGTQTELALVTDPLTGASYQAHHSVSSGVLSESINTATTAYYVSFIGETGGDSDPVTVYPVIATYTVTSMDDGL